ncbi:hypothetical protein ONS95_013694 [Cadophora gregata]|uniref:uncharacterized protein n=1 Tax=Cadophora gregata TaxID=51156 RepID=UPI0026DBE01A|nr:uncharacterized protein ONS95_013694 [Cadophora gregata]KAK0113436.1 hypothetical protein ONS96_014302 [Cadophora gregata f. sp. sojae]KAK0114194.1 hypothetical protein ONS95_013694 [Cadophora gregata]
MKSTYWYMMAMTALMRSVRSIITQQDPSQLTLDTADPRKYYYLEKNNGNPLDNSTSFRVKAAQGTTPTGAVTCDANTLCPDASCCGLKNICGFGPDYCGQGCQHNCSATAPCGRYSDDDGNIPCGMNLCCSYYGYCGFDNSFCAAGATGCQEAYGSCQTQQPFTCANGDATKRTIAYYQGGNVYSADRKCGQANPSDLDVSGYTHLYWAFPEISASHEVVSSDARDQNLYKDFTALKSDKLETWISIGGFDYTTNNPDSWSSMVSTVDTCKTFINSIVGFMKNYGFQGVDLDWEYPVDPMRGGQKNDMQNLVALVREMRANPDFGQNFGISVTLAPDINYLQHFDAKGLIKYASFLGFMSYDLHGTWDGDLPMLAKRFMVKQMATTLSKI